MLMHLSCQRLTVLELIVDPASFGEALLLITKDAYKDNPDLKETTDKLESALRYLPSPPTDERAEMSKKYSEQYKLGK